MKAGVYLGGQKNLNYWPFRMGWMTTALDYDILIFKVIIPGLCDRPVKDLNVPLNVPGLRFSALSVRLPSKHAVITTAEQREV